MITWYVKNMKNSYPQYMWKTFNPQKAKWIECGKIILNNAFVKGRNLFFQLSTI